MPKFVVRVEGPIWEEVRRSVAALSREVDGESADLNRVGKALASVVGAVAAAFTQAELPSLRMSAAQRALDLKTPRGALEAFVRG